MPWITCHVFFTFRSLLFTLNISWATCDHHEEYTRVVKDFVLLCSMEWGWFFSLTFGAFAFDDKGNGMRTESFGQFKTWNMDVVNVLFPLVILESVEQAVISYLCRIGYEWYDRVLSVAVNGFEHFRSQLLSQLFALTVDIPVGTAREVYVLKWALIVFLFL